MTLMTVCVIDFTDAKKNKFRLNLQCNGEESYLYLNKTVICKFRSFDVTLS